VETIAVDCLPQVGIVDAARVGHAAIAVLVETTTNGVDTTAAVSLGKEPLYRRRGARYRTFRAVSRTSVELRAASLRVSAPICDDYLEAVPECLVVRNDCTTTSGDCLPHLIVHAAVIDGHAST